MKEMASIRSNQHMVLMQDSKTKEIVLDPRVEVIFLVSEPVYRIDDVGEQVRSRELEAVRIMMTPKQLILVSKYLTQVAEDANSEVKKWTRKPATSVTEE